MSADDQLIHAPDEVAPAQPAPTARRRGLAVIALLVVASLGLGWFSLATVGDLRDRKAVEQARTEAVAAAKQFAVLVSSYDSGKLDENFAAVLDGATGDFYEQYKAASDSLAATIRSVDGSSIGSVGKVGVVSASRSEVALIVFVDQKVTNKSQAEPRVDRSRMELVMVLRGDRWLASELNLV